MKLAWKQIEPFVKSPDPKARVILVYGPDNGLMRERAKKMALTVIEDLEDPFNVVTLSGDILIEDPARLSDEANAMSMMGGARLIRIDSGTDKISVCVKDYLDNNPSPENLVIIHAGELGPRSSLRQLCEKAKNAAAVPCYVEDERDVASLIREMLSGAGLRIDADAQSWFSANIMGDRARARNEIEKLILYMGEGEKTVRLEDVQASCGEAGASTLDDLIYSVAGANPQKAMASYHRLIGEGVPEITILRSLQNHFRRLHYTNALINEGKSAEEAVKSLQPPIFFKVEPAFKAQLGKWKGQKLDTVLGKLSDLEAQTKMTGAPVQTLCAQAILSLSVMR